MAEAFATLGIAANIAQFVSYGIQLVSTGREIYSSIEGAQDRYHELEIIIEDIKAINAETVFYNDSCQVRGFLYSSDESAILQLVGECESLADKLLVILSTLKVSKDARFRRLETLRQTLKVSVKDKDIQDLKERLLGIDDRLRARILAMLQRQVAA
jgi:archaellum biogenesis ATPase FlaH